MSNPCKSCRECPITGSQLEEKDIQSIIDKAKEIEARPLSIQTKFMEKMEYLGIQDLVKIKRDQKT